MFLRSGLRDLRNVSLAGLMVLMSAGCGNDLEYGAYSGEFSGEATALNGSTSAYTSTTLLDIAYSKERGKLTYEVDLCEGFVDYISSSPCFATIAVEDTKDGLIGLSERSWSLVMGDEESLACQGTESISIAGSIDGSDAAQLELTYHLNLTGSNAGDCAVELGSHPAKIIAAGGVSHI